MRALYCIMHYSASTAPLPMQLILYFLIGSSCAVLDLISFQIMRRLGLGLNAAVAASFVLAALLNYVLCISFLFRHKAKWNASGEAAAYLISIGIMGALDWHLTRWLAASGMAQGMAKALAALVGFWGNFILRRFIVFPEKRGRKDAG